MSPAAEFRWHTFGCHQALTPAEWVGGPRRTTGSTKPITDVACRYPQSARVMALEVRLGGT
jgi:hypothetical protein